MAVKKPIAVARARNILKMAAPARAALAFIVGAASPSVALCAGLWVPGTIVTNLPDAFVLQYDQTFTAPGQAIYVPISVPAARSANGVAFSASCYGPVNFRAALYTSDPRSGEITSLKGDAGFVTIPGNKNTHVFNQYKLNFSAPVSLSANAMFYVALTQQSGFGCYIVAYEPYTFKLHDNSNSVYFKSPLTAGVVFLPGINDSRIPVIYTVFSAPYIYGPWPSTPPAWGSMNITANSSVPIVGIY